MYYRKASGFRRLRALGIRLLIFGLIFLLLLFFADRKLRPIILNSASIRIKAIATTALNEAITQTLAETADNDSYVALEKGSDGKVTSVQTDSAAIGKAQTTLTRSVMTCLSKLENDRIEISLGTLLRPEHFSGKGPKLHFYVRPHGYATTRIISSFSEAGINQTQHKLLFQVSVPVSGGISGYRSEVVIEADFILADTVIVGDVPGYYTNVITEDQSLVEDLNDYAPGALE